MKSICIGSLYTEAVAEAFSIIFLAAELHVGGLGLVLFMLVVLE